jgi:DNA-binding response OmpR family regulator
MQSDGRDRGSTFEVRIPIAHAPLEEERLRVSVSSPQPEARQRRVLVVEDNEDIRESSCEILKMTGFDVMAVSTGSDALEEARSFGPNVILLDVGLPDLSGYEVARRLREVPQFVNTVLIAVTGYDTPEARALSAAAGFNHHVCKPVNFDELEKLIN